MRQYGIYGQAFPPIGFLAAAQADTPGTSIQILTRSRASMAGMMASIRRTLAQADPGMSFHFHVFKQQIREGFVQERLMATLSGFFGFLAAVLATLGLYGVMSYMVARRRNEIGLRMALGADRSDVLRMVLSEAGVLLLIGLVAGTVVAMLAVTAASKLLFGLQPHAPTTLVLAASALATITVVASYLPARRAARLDPMVALREE
jgi:putative ABC transport system permease protein